MNWLENSCRFAVQEETTFIAKLTVSIGRIPVMAIFSSTNGAFPPSLYLKDALITSSLKEDSSSTVLIYSLPPGQYLVPFGLLETGNSYAMITLYAAHPLRFFSIV